MPWTVDRDTGELVGFSGPKQTIESHQHAIKMLWEGWGRYFEADLNDITGWVGLHEKAIRELRALESAY